MATILAKGPAPLSRGAMLGESMGAALGTSAVKGFEDARAAQMYDPVREALTSAMAGIPANNPVAGVLQSITQDPRVFAQVMQNPQQLQALANMGSAMATQPAELTETEQMLEAREMALEAAAAGDVETANLLHTRARYLANRSSGETPRDLSLDFVQVTVPGAEPQTLQTDKKGNFFDLAGELVKLPPNAVLTEGLRSGASSGGGLGLELQYGVDQDGNIRTYQVDSAGGLVPANPPDPGVSMMPPGSQMAFIPEAIQRRGQAQTAVEVERQRALLAGELDKLVQSGKITNQQRLDMEAALTPLLVERSAQQQSATGDIANRQAAERDVTETDYARYATEEVPRAQAAASTIQQIDRFLAQEPSAGAGALQPLLDGVKRLFGTFGINPESLTASSLMNASTAQLFGDIMGQYGARNITEQEMTRLAQALPQLNTSHEARVAVAELVKDIAQQTLSRFDQVDRFHRGQPYGQLIAPMPWLDEWRSSALTPEDFINSLP